MNINEELFKKYSPRKKLGMVNMCSTGDLFLVSNNTIIRILKEVGNRPYGKQRSNNKSLRLLNAVSNNWNAKVTEISIYKNRLFLNFYLQYSNTDTTISEHLNTFLQLRDYRGSHYYEDAYGNGQTAYFIYDIADKARVIREILITYIKLKYAVKLKIVKES